MFNMERLKEYNDVILALIVVFLAVVLPIALGLAIRLFVEN